MSSPVNSGTVDWSGDNPGIYLKDASGNWSALAVYFRVVVSPHGSGIGSVVLGAPAKAAGFPDVPNVCISNNERLMRWLIENFVSKFGSFRDMNGLQAMSFHAITSHETSGDGRTFHQESLRSREVSTVLRWNELGPPFAVDVQPAMSATGEHEMFSTFVEARQGSIAVNDRALAGNVIQRDFLDRRMSTAFLAFSETWLRPNG